MKHIILFIISLAILTSCTKPSHNDQNNIIIENDEVKLMIGNNGIAQSLIFKPTGEECLLLNRDIPVFSATQERPYNNEVKLAHPNKKTTYPADTIYREGNNLIVGFETIPYEAVIRVEEKAEYITFSLVDFIVEEEDYNVKITPPPTSELCILQLPVRNRQHFGEWLNVSWDNKLAVNILATDPFARIDSEKRKGYRIMKADAVKEVKLKGVTAALIVCESDKLLDHIAKMEEDFDLPRGVESRRNEIINRSYYWSSGVNPDNLEQHLKYAKMGGFRCMMLYYPSFIDSRGYRMLGDYEWNLSLYPNGKEDLVNMLNTIESQGITPGFHFLHSHIGRDSKYVTPIPDHRLNLLRYFTLAEPIGRNDTEIFVEQNPEGTTTADGCRVLKIGTELISFEGYTTTPPYKFTGCVRGIDETTVNAQPRGYIFGLLDVSEFGATSVYIDENTSLQDEIAEKLADIYDAGFRFIYFDGSEGVNPPFWFNVASAQYKVFKRLLPEPVFAEGAAKTHFSWHMLSGGNAFDVFRPEYLKEAIRKYPAEEAPRMREDFTRINFGWLGYWIPDENTVGTQPDMLEYVTSRAAAWDCPVSVHVNLQRFDAHPRTPDNLEVFRRWEEVRVQNWLSDDQKKMLQNLHQEHILLINENDEFELIPYDQISDVAGGSRDVRAFIFDRNNDMYVVYWHISDSKNLELPLNAANVKLHINLGEEESVSSAGDNSVTVPVNNRRYLQVNGLSREQVIDAFKNAKITN
ncbi:MAG: hypothetical protein PHH93_01845 [Prolixibacteraceae bacterium]|nr:hypothetical protein [Prolixibacteraceae bacterium]